MCGGSPAAIERMLSFGREVQHMSQLLRLQLGKSDNNKKILQVRGCLDVCVCVCVCIYIH